MTTLETLYPTNTTHLRVVGGEIAVDLSGFVRQRTQTVLSSTVAEQPVLDLPDEVVISTNTCVQPERHFAILEAAEIVIDGEHYLPLLAPGLISNGQKTIAISSRCKLEYYGPNTAWAIVCAFLSKLSSVCRQRPVLEVECTAVSNSIRNQFAAPAIQRLCEIRFSPTEEKPSDKRQTLFLTSAGPMLNGILSEVPENPVRLFENLLKNLRLFTPINSNQTHFPAIFQCFFRSFFSHVEADIGGDFKFCVVNKQDIVSGEASSSSQLQSGADTETFDDLLSTLQCDFEADGDCVELKFDVGWFLNDYKIALMPLLTQIKQIGTDQTLQLGGELFKGPLERLVVKELASADLKRIE